ncbi:MAG: DNA-processing protein DprA [Myxococcota bacterium]
MPDRSHVPASRPPSGRRAGGSVLDSAAASEGRAPDAEASAPLDPTDSRPHRRAELLAWLRLQAALGLRPVDAIEGLRAGHAPDTLWRLADAAGRARALRVREGGSAWRALVRHRVCAVPWSSPAYPARLRPLRDAPPLLLVQGDCAAWRRPCVAIVGARAATGYGRGVARELARALAARGVVVVSGLARGIDAAAHEGALDAEGASIAVQARGPDDVYPAAHRALALRLRERGAVVTELGPGVAPRRAFFPLRNRLISALAGAVVVVEARRRSGSLVTARHAADQGVEVLAVPGRIDAPTSEGTNELLRDGAAVALGADDVLAALGMDPEPAPGPSRAAEAADSPLVRALRDAPATRDELAARLGARPEALALELAELEIDGRIALERDGRLHVRTRR